MHKKLSLGINLALAGNLLFILFGIICYWFQSSYDPKSSFSAFLEKTAYTTLFAGFIALAAAEILLWRTVRMRLAVKLAFAFYILMEAFMMYCELHSFDVMSFYDPYSMKLAILHAVLSAAVCFAFVYLDPYKTPYEVTIIICIGLILGGMFGNLIGVRVYFSIFMNAVAFSALFFAIRHMLKREVIEIDCYGDKARVAEYKSVFFEEEVDDDEEDEAVQAEEPAEVNVPEKEEEPAAKSEPEKEKKAPADSREKISGDARERKPAQGKNRPAGQRNNRKNHHKKK